MRVKFFAQGNNSNNIVATPGIEPTAFRLVGRCSDHLAMLPHVYAHVLYMVSSQCKTLFMATFVKRVFHQVHLKQMKKL